MKFKKIILLLFTVYSIGQLKAQSLSIIPEPINVTIGKGVYQLPKSIAINAPSSAKEVTDQITKQISKATGRNITFSKNDANITLEILKFEVLGSEGYTLNVNANGIVIGANTNAGLFYGWQTLQQIMPAAIFAKNTQANTQWQLPYVSIMDKPRFAWRGLMLDVSRHFFTKAEVKKYIDDMVRYKYNVLHLHLTDDQGWRIEIKSMPKLTEVGAWRPERKGKWANTKAPALDEPKSYGGFYTHEDIKELVAYAKSKFVEIVPEIDVPGHSMAMLAAYPELSTVPTNKFSVNIGQEFIDWEGMNGHITAKIENTLNPASEKVYTALDKIFGEVAELFPSSYIHMGGDECPKNNWEKSSDVLDLMKRENLKNQQEVQSYFVKRVEKIINSKGKKLMGWDEILEGGLPGNAAVMSWRGMKGGIEAAKQNHKVVMSPNDYTYIDYYQGEVTAEGKVYQGLRLNRTYQFEPLPEGIEPTMILGGQANLWTEQVQDIRNAEYMTYPRALAVAESVWSPKEKKNWDKFVGKVEQHFEKLDAAEVKYAKSMYDAIVTTNLNTKGELLVSVASEISGLSFYYSLDESLPDNYSNAYSSTFVLPEDVSILRIIGYRDGKQIGKLLSIPMESLKSRAKRVL